jgi:hypothetical protein
MHAGAVLRLINQKGLDVQCRKLAKAVDKLAGTLENIKQPVGHKGATTKDDQESCKVEIGHTQEMLQEAQSAHNKAVAKTYELLRNLLSSDAQSQWDRICREMHKHDSWVGVNGQVTTPGRHPHLWTAFQDCLELHKLTVFTADAPKRQCFYIQQVVHKPQRATVQQHILQMKVLNDYIRHCPMLKDSPNKVGGLDQFSCKIQNFLAGSLATSGQKKVYRT